MSKITVELIKRNTAFKTDKRAEAVLETYKWLKAGAPKKFDGLDGKFKFNMALFIQHKDEESKRPDPECGTACCIAGAIRMFERDGKTYRFGHPRKEISDMFPEVHTDSNLGNLFYASRGCVSLASITPKGAATTLRRYFETGTVSWYGDEQ